MTLLQLQNHKTEFYNAIVINWDQWYLTCYSIQQPKLLISGICLWKTQAIPQLRYHPSPEPFLIECPFSNHEEVVNIDPEVGCYFTYFFYTEALSYLWSSIIDWTLVFKVFDHLSLPSPPRCRKLLVKPEEQEFHPLLQWSKRFRL